MTLELALQNHKIMDFFKNLSTQGEFLENLNKLDKAYYDGNPLIPDSTYDAIRGYANIRFPELKKKVGKKDENSVWPKVSLEIPMGSLDKVNDTEDLQKWYAKYTSGLVVGTHKVDGSSVELLFENGTFIRGVTRGDGFVGDDITPNARKMKFPKTINEKGITRVRGEIVLLNSDFDTYFAPKGDKNPRNSAAGTTRRLDGTGAEHLTVIAFDIISDENDFARKIEKFTHLKKLGFQVPNPIVIPSMDDIKQVIDYTNTNRKSIPYMIDGLVFEENDLEKAEAQGITDNRPKAAKAYKFEAESAITTLLDVVWQVGKIGAITPVGVITPTTMQGVTISRVMLNNLAHITELGLELGSECTLIRANDVIPKIVSVSVAKTGKKIVPPSKCPSCGSLLNTADPKHIICENHEECPAQGAYRMVAFLDVLGVKGMGDKIIEKLMDAGLVKDFTDLYTLDIERAGEIEGVSKVVLQKSYKELIQKSSKVTLPKFVKSISIKNIGESATEKVMPIYPTIHDLFNMKYEVLLGIEGIGESIASDFIMGINSKKELILKLLKYITITKQSAGPLTDKVFVFTGFRDALLQEKIEELGGSIGASVTKATTHLVCASTSSLSTKAEKAKKEGKEIISKEQLIELLKA